MNGPVAYLVFGVLAGPVGLGWLNLSMGGEVIGMLAEFTLALVLSLTVIRMLPVFLSLLGLGVSNDAKLFLGWFGPRGLASIVFLVIVVKHDLPGENTIIATTIATVVLSILAHGLTANPLAAAFGARSQARSADRA